MKHLAFLICGLLCFGTARSQFSDSVNYYAGYTSTGTYNRTNLNSNYVLNNALKLSVKKKSLTGHFTNKWLYGEQDDVLTNNDFNSALDVNLYKTFPRFYYWGLVNYTSAYSLKINHQLQSGLGVAYVFIDRPNAFLSVSDGFIYEYDDILVDDSVRKVYNIIRNSLRVQLKGNVGTRFTYAANGFYQPSMYDVKDFILKADASIGVKLRKWLTITAGMSYNEMSATGSQNLFMNYGLVVEKYF